MKTRLNKRIFACFLSVLMLLSVMPFNVFAADATGSLSVSGLSVTYEKLAGNASSCTLSGTTITATAKSNSGLSDKTAGKTQVTLTNTGSATAALSFSYTGTGVENLTINGEESGTGSGSLTKALAAGEVVVIVFSSDKGTAVKKNTATLTITDISLVTEKDVNVTFKNVYNGSYTLDGSAVNADVTLTKKSTESFAVSANAASDYAFYAWYNETTGKYISYEANTSLTLTDDAVVYPVFVSNDAARFGVGSTSFISLTDACEFAKTSTIKTVVLLNSGTISGSHTIPAGITLLVPFDDDNTLYTNEPECTSKSMNNAAWVQPTAYRTLTLASDAKITVNGAISISGKHAASNGSKPYCGAPTGPVGWVQMLEGSEITVNNGANLYVWGFIQGAGTVIAKNGAHLYENFQFTDFRGGSNLALLMADLLVFPINQYYVQNIEVPTIFEAGAKETLYTSAYAGSMCAGGAAPFIGEGGMFIVNDGYIVKDYIEDRDRLQVDIYGDITMSSMSVEVAKQTISSSDYVLPITNNITININSGTTSIGQSMALLPGVEMTVGKKATLALGASDKEMLNDYMTGGYHLIVYDRDEWFYGYDLNSEEIVENLNFVFGEGSKDGFNPLRFAPGRTYERTADDIKDAVLDVNGTIVLDGALYTTMSGAAVKSSEETGKIVMQSGSGVDILNFQAVAGKSYGVFMNSASLMNGDGSYLATGPSLMDDTIPYTEPGTTFNYCAKCNEWTTDEPCSTSSYTVTWMNGSEFLGNQEVEEGTVPYFHGASMPAKAADNNAHYIFAGWSTTNGGAAANLPAVTGNATYYAVYTSEAHADEDKVATEGKHHCDTCGFIMYSCSDKAGDSNHECDYGCGRVLSECSGGTATCKEQAKCTECGEYYGDKLTHKYEAKVTEPTCEDDGYTTHTCTGCGDSYVDSKVDALGHEWDKGVIKPEPSCNGEGTKTFTCGLCGDTKTEVVSALGHTKGEEVTENIEEADCVNDGSYDKVVYCTVCGEELSRNTFTVDALGHTPGEKVTENEVPADCENDGSYDEVVYCTVCGEETSRETFTVDALGHTPGEAVTENEVPADCVNDGSYDEVVYCTVCGAELDRETFTVDALGHTPGEAVTENEKDADCVNDGSYDEVVYCTVCGEELSRNTVKVDALGHKEEKLEGKDATCEDEGLTEGKQCTVCGVTTVAQETIDALGHDYDDGVINTEPTCNDDGVKTFTCGNCGDTYTEAVSAKGHTEGETVTENEKAADCVHDGSYDEVVYCTVCGAELSRKTFTVDALGHTSGEAVTENEKAADCVNDGSYDEVVYCTVCGAELSRKTFTVDALGHTSGEKVTENEKAADCVNDGSYDEVVYCTVCGEELSRETCTVDALGHSYSELDGKCVCGDALVGWNELNGNWYYFFENNTRAEGITHVAYPTEKIDGIEYAADKETLDYSASTGKPYPDAEAGFFFFDEEGKFVNDFTGIKEFMDADRYFENGFIKWHPGVVEVEGETYYFIGDVVNGGNLPANGDTYIIRNNGADEFEKGTAYNFENGKLSGADGIVDGKYYEDSKLMMGKGLTKLEDKYIYVRYDGTLVIDAEYWVGTNNENIVPGLYTFDADGYMIDIKTTDKDGIYYENGAYYFYEKGVLAYKGLIKYSGEADNGTVYDNDWIYVRSNGQLAANRAYWTTKNDTGELKTQNYNFDECGRMINKNGIIEENGNLYYYVNGNKQQCLGLIEIDGKFYYVRTAGELVRGREYWITNVNDTGVVARNYYFDNNGVMQNPVYEKEEVNGVVDGYYYEDGKIAYGAGLVQLEDGSIIYVRSNGQLATGIYWPTTLNGVLPAGKYNFGTDGRLVVA